MKLKILIFNFSFLILTACGATKPVVNAHHERIETQMQPIPIAADTIIIENVFSAGVASASSVDFSPRLKTVGSVRDKNNSVRISSTRALKIESRQTDSTEKLILTLKPDTVYVPYTTHIRSDTIVVPDPTTKAKLATARWKIALLIILMLIIIVVKIRTNGL